METLQTRNGVEDSEGRTFNTFDGVRRKKEEQPNVMFEGKNIHSSPVDGKFLCSYSEKVCKQRRLNGYAFCIRHVLEDKNAPFKQCQFVAKYNGQQCTNPIPLSEERIYCNSHLQVLGIVPKKNRKKKPIESIESNSNSVLNSSETNLKLDGVMSHTTSMVFVPPVAIPFHRKKTKLHTEKKETLIPAVSEVKDRNNPSQQGRHNLFSVYGVESSDDSDSSSEGSEVPLQDSWFLSEDDCCNMPFTNRETDRFDEHRSVKQESDPRTIKLSKLSSRLRRELHQLHRSLRANHYRHRELSASIASLLKVTRAGLASSVTGTSGDSILSKSTSYRKEKPQNAVFRKCSYVECTQSALPYTRFCCNHIIEDKKQILYANCTAEFSDGKRCSVPVFDIIHERPLCQEHARKKDEAAKTNGVTLKQPAKKPRRKVQPKLTANQRPSKSIKKLQRKHPSKSNRVVKVAKLVEFSDSSVLDDSFAADRLAMSPDYSHTTEMSPGSPNLEDLQHFDTPLFDSQQQDNLMLQPTTEVEENGPSDILSDNISIRRNGMNSDDNLFQESPKTTSITSWPLVESVQTSVITTPKISKQVSEMGPPLLHSNHLLSRTDREIKGRSSPLNRASRITKPKPMKPRETKLREPKTRELKSRETNKGLSKVFRPSYSIESIIASSLNQNNMDVTERSSPTHLTLSEDPMFSPPQSVLSSTSNSNLNSEHLHSPSRVSVNSIDNILSPTRRPWPGIATTASESFSSPLNSQTSSRITSPPFSPTSVSPHIVSPHRPAQGNVFDFDRPPSSHLLHSSVTSPRLSPLSPFLQTSQVKQPLTFSRLPEDLDQRQGDDNDLFLESLIEKEHSMFGHHFHQSSDPSHGDLRLR